MESRKEALDWMDKEEEKKKNRRKRRTAATAVAAVTSAGVVMGGLFSSPDDLMNGADGDDAPIPLADTVTPDAGGAGDDDLDDDAGDTEDENRRRGGLRARARQWVRQWPAGVRALVGVPLWALGWLVITLATAAWNGVFSPLFGTVLGWVLTAAALLGAFALTGKAMFPDLPLKKILTRQNFLALLIGTAALGIVNAVVPLFWDGYGKIAGLVRALGSAALLGTVTALFARRENRRRKKLAEKAAREEEAEEAPETMDEALARARELADSVGHAVY